MNGRLLCYVRGFTQLPQKRKAATYFEGPGGHGRPLLAGSYVTQRVRLAYSKPGTSTGRVVHEKNLHIYVLELKTCQLALLSFCKEMRDSHVQTFMDNPTNVAYISTEIKH